MKRIFVKFLFCLFLNGLVLGNDYLSFSELFKQNKSKKIHIFSEVSDEIKNLKIIPLEFYPIINGEKNVYDLKYYALGSIDLTDKTEGYIIREPSIDYYFSTYIVLYVFDKKTHKLMNSIPLADSKGDGDWSMDMDSWIEDINDDGMLDIVTRVVNFEEDRISSDKLYVYFQKNGEFIQSKKFNELDLRQKYIIHND